jgi:citrate lyase beta subunit
MTTTAPTVEGDARRRYAGMTTLLEVPILNPAYWAKVPDTPADAILLDLEDSATPATKAEARARIVEALAEPSYFGGRGIIVRVNNLATEWGADDLRALATVETDFLVCYPKVESAAELAEVRATMAAAGHERGLYVMIETAAAVLALDAIAGAPGVVGLHFGYVDFAADVGSRPFAESGDDLYAPATAYARSKIAVAAAAHKLFASGGTLIPEYRDLDKVRTFVRSWADLGYTACIAVSPRHLPIIREELAPTAAEIARARAVCAAYEEAVGRGEPAAVLDGRVITNPDYRVAGLVLARAGEPGVTP